MELKKGCQLSPTLFSIYVNDLAEDIKRLNAGVDIDDLNISILLYADDIADRGKITKILFECMV